MPLPPRFHARLRKLPLRLRRALSGGTEGLHVSKQRGAGLSFIENRRYIPGDDPRVINWPLTARYGELVVKRFEASRELILWLLIDPSPSMFLGDPVTPLRWAIELAAAATAALMAGKDRMGLIIPGDRDAPAIRLAPKRGQSACLRILESIADLTPRIPNARDWRGSLGRWTDSGRGHHLWLLSNGGGAAGLGPLLKPIAARHRVVWFYPMGGSKKQQPPLSDNEMPSNLEVQNWNMNDDPVKRLGQWLKSGA
ncbi:MAG: DUF58 domain-containing protein [Holophagales bacterium]|jgi:hypothetical protein|nr:DUF58 domain-containing protein [Holophagales bacterium]